MSSTQMISQWIKRISHSRTWVRGVYIALGVILFAALFGRVKPDDLNIKLLSIAKKTIHSPITIEDKVTTEQKRREAADKVEDQYTYRSEYKQNRIDIVNSVFDAVKEVWAENKAAPIPSVTEQVEKVKKKLPTDLVKTLTDQGILILINAPVDETNVAREYVVTTVNNLMSTQIKIHDAETAKKQLANELRYANIANNLKETVVSLGQYAIVPNYFYDEVATKERKQTEKSAVAPVYILQGQVIVKEGDTIKRDIYEQLQLVGLVDKQNVIEPALGLGILLVILLYFVHRQFATFLKVHNDKPYVLTYGIVVSVTILLMKIISLFQKVEYTGMSYVVPVAMGTMLVKLMIDDRFIFLTSILFSISGSIMFNEGVTSAFNYPVGIYMLLSSLSVGIFLREKNRRSMILQAGIGISLFNVALVSMLLLLRNGHFSPFEVGLQLALAASSGFVSAVLTLGILPYLESSLGIVSAFRLMELGSPNHPLLRKILLEAPGTYHHSIMVANLSEAACEAIGANGLLARVGAYYHDIGKTLHPHFFIENQMGLENPHDKLTPELSRDIIIAHVTDGVKLLREHKIPEEIVAVAAEHHGTTLLKYFYYKAMQEDVELYTEDMFRYPGPKASSKESAIVGIADSVEAAVRSLRAPTACDIGNLVKGIVTDRLQDEQFSECDLTFRELEIITRTLCETLNGIFHSRIKYPDLKEKKG